MKKYFLFIMIFLFFSGISIAQKKRKIFSFAASPVFFKGVRLDLGVSIDSSHTVILSPQFYGGTVNWNGKAGRANNFVNYSGNLKHTDKLSGSGVDIFYKYYFLRKLMKQGYLNGPYVGLAARYQHFKIDYHDYSWQSFDQDSLTYYTWEQTDNQQNIDRIGGQINFGYTFLIGNILIFDLFVGTGFRKSYVTDTNPGGRQFDRYFWDYGYTGPYPAAGWRIGLLLF